MEHIPSLNLFSPFSVFGIVGSTVVEFFWIQLWCFKFSVLACLPLAFYSQAVSVKLLLQAFIKTGKVYKNEIF